MDLDQASIKRLEKAITDLREHHFFWHARFAMESYLFQLNSWARIRFRLGNWRHNFSISVNCNSFANRIHTDTR